MQNRVDADHVEDRFLLTGKRRVGQVFGRGRGTNGDGDFFLTVLEPIVEFADFAFEFGRERGRFDPAADFRAGGRQGLHVVDVEVGEAFVNTFLKAAFAKEEAERFGRRREAVGNTDARARQLAQEFAERSVLAAHSVHVRHAKLTKGKYVTTLYHCVVL